MMLPVCLMGKSLGDSSEATERGLTALGWWFLPVTSVFPEIEPSPFGAQRNAAK